MLLFLLQVNATDLTFRLMDVIYIIVGTASVVTAVITIRNNNTKTSDKIALEVEARKELEGRLKEVENSLDTLEGDLSKKIDNMGREIQLVSLSIEKMKNEILERLLDKK